jgi:hypothetical protein
MSIEEELNKLENVCRIESFAPSKMEQLCIELTHAVYEHDKIYGQYVTIEEYIDCPPDVAFNYLANDFNLGEWTYSIRNVREDKDTPGLYISNDVIGNDTIMYFKTISNKESMTVDFHCAWDQKQKLWMIYLMRVVPAELVLNKAGSVVTWTNCRHQYYYKNPFPETAPPKRKVWVGDIWDLFYAGHHIEMQNLKHILEYRYRNNLL